jgi:4-amino-4-deoxy-L-arabinose transferase-like glycosyltransferase
MGNVACSLLALTAVAAGLRLWGFDRVPPNPFYDAAVRSMALSWHNFFYGALEPGGSVSIDKPPIDLWLQVASVKALGFTSVALRLPQAIAGTLAVPLLYDLVRRGFGQAAGLVAGVALAVLPAAVLTGRSDTMDTLMGTLLLASAWVIVVAAPRLRERAVILAAALAGLAFEVKLFEVAVALPALVALAAMAPRRPGSDTRRMVLRAGTGFVVTAALWPVAAAVAPGAHPWPAGSTDGSIANAIFVYNGADRLGYPTPGSFSTTLPAPGPIRLLRDGPDHYARMIGAELLPALILFAFSVWSQRRRLHSGGMGTAVAVCTGVWLLCGYLLFSLQGRPRLRYMEAFTPSVAGALGIGLAGTVAVLARRRRWSTPTTRVVATVLAAALLAWPLVSSVHLARAGAEDSQTLGAFPATQVTSLSRYLRARQGHARYELASADTIIAAPLVAHDGRPVLMLTSWRGEPFTSAATLERLARAGEVRYLLLAETGCRTPSAPSCSPAAQWALRHATDVSRAAGLGPSRILVRLTASG